VRTIQKPINTKCSITDCQSRWFIQLPLDLEGLTVIYRLGITVFLSETLFYSPILISVPSSLARNFRLSDLSAQFSQLCIRTGNAITDFLQKLLDRPRIITKRSPLYATEKLGG
jgi:hypothetical protein